MFVPNLKKSCFYPANMLLRPDNSCNLNSCNLFQFHSQTVQFFCSRTYVAHGTIFQPSGNSDSIEMQTLKPNTGIAVIAPVFFVQLNFGSLFQRSINDKGAKFLRKSGFERRVSFRSYCCIKTLYSVSSHYEFKYIQCTSVPSTLRPGLGHSVSTSHVIYPAHGCAVLAWFKAKIILHFRKSQQYEDTTRANFHAFEQTNISKQLFMRESQRNNFFSIALCRVAIFKFSRLFFDV